MFSVYSSMLSIYSKLGQRKHSTANLLPLNVWKLYCSLFIQKTYFKVVSMQEKSLSLVPNGPYCSVLEKAYIQTLIKMPLPS